MPSCGSFLSSISRFFSRLEARSRLPLGALPLGALAIALSGCTLITDVDREKIPVPVQPPFTEVDAGPEPPLVVPDASLPDASAAGDAGDVPDAALGDAGDAADAALPSDAG